MIEVQVEGAEELARKYEHLMLELGPVGLQGFLRTKVNPFLQGRIDRRFANEGDDAVGKWFRLAYATGLIRARKGFPAYHPINKRTGGLYQFVRNTDWTRGTPDGATMTKPKLGGPRETQVKLRHAQQGGVGFMGPFPARPVMGLGRQDQVGIERRFEQWTDSIIARIFA